MDEKRLDELVEKLATIYITDAVSRRPMGPGDIAVEYAKAVKQIRVQLSNTKM